jgi:hypothetical protein
MLGRTVLRGGTGGGFVRRRTGHYAHRGGASCGRLHVGSRRRVATCVHIEIDGQWKTRGWAPPDFPLILPIDVQGYVYWDILHASESVPLNSALSGYVLGHYKTGCEIHPVPAWRLHRR